MKWWKPAKRKGLVGDKDFKTTVVNVKLLTASK